MKHRERSKNSIFRMMFLSYGAMLILPILALLFTYGAASIIIKEEIQTYNQYLLDECMSSTEEIFGRADDSMNSLAFSRPPRNFWFRILIQAPVCLSGQKGHTRVWQIMKKYMRLPGS